MMTDKGDDDDDDDDDDETNKHQKRKRSQRPRIAYNFSYKNHFFARARGDLGPCRKSCLYHFSKPAPRLPVEFSILTLSPLSAKKCTRRKNRQGLVLKQRNS